MFISSSYAQYWRKELHVGDTVPDLVIPLVINYPKPSVRISDFRGRLLILDFWSTICGTCIATFPKLEKLQKTFGDQIMILPVTFYKSKEHNVAFFEKRRKAGKSINLPSVVQDSLLYHYFPSFGLPHIAIISPEGVYLGSPDYLYLDENHIRSLLKSNKVNVRLENLQWNFDVNKPLLVDGNGGPDSAFQYRSMLSGFIDSLMYSSFKRQKTTKYNRIFVSNFTVNEMYVDLYHAVHPDDSIFLRLLQDKGPVLAPEVIYRGYPKKEFANFEEREQFKQQQLFCYDLILPPSFSTTEMFSFMKQDLDRYFKLRSVVQTRKVSTLKLEWKKAWKNNEITENSGSVQPVVIEELGDSILYAGHHSSLGELVRILNRMLPLPVIQYVADPAALSFSFVLARDASEEELRQVLQPYGLVIKPTMTKLKQLYIMRAP